jgi:sporulation protein YlmC with PRC-barrel domain
MTEDRPIAWLALVPGTPIIASDGEQVGKVAEVIADREKDIFSGITFKPGILDSPVFVPADKIGELTESEVKLTIVTAEAERLEPYDS